jgi:hypothetical protein
MSDPIEERLRRLYGAGPVQEPVPESLLARLASLPAQKRPLIRWPDALAGLSFTPTWPRLAALAGAAVLGITIGLSGLGMRIATDLDLVRVTTADDIPNNIFDLEAGLRP